MLFLDFNRYRIIDISCTAQHSPEPLKPFVTEKSTLPDGTYAHRVTIGSHTGTHIEVGSHFYDHGESIEKYPLSSFIGRGILINAEPGLLTADFARKAIGHIIQPQDIIIIRNTRPASGGKVYMTPESAGWFAEYRIKMLGIDGHASLGFSVEDARKVHDRILCYGGVFLEGLHHLQDIRKELFYVMAFPFKAQLDSSWTRAIIIEDL